MMVVVVMAVIVMMVRVPFIRSIMWLPVWVIVRAVMPVPGSIVVPVMVMRTAVPVMVMWTVVPVVVMRTAETLAILIIPHGSVYQHKGP